MRGLSMSRPRTERVEIVCAECGNIFSERASRHRRYCSRRCANAATAGRYEEAQHTKICAWCGCLFRVRTGRLAAKYCSFACRQVAIARMSAALRGDLLRGRGAGRSPYIKRDGQHEHRAVMEAHCGHTLSSDEVVHHKDGNGHNNTIENLVVMSRSEHARLHARS
ncbi:MAG: HNH endonuclease [bacterium]